MAGSAQEPGEFPASPVAVDPARPGLAQPATARWVALAREPRVVTIGLAVVALAFGAWWVRLSVSEPSGALTKAHAGTRSTGSVPARNVGPSASLAPTTTTGAVFVVDVVGAVQHPGVVSMPSTARVVDAVTAAGGALAAADLDRINLAAHLVDGMRIAVPRRGFPADQAGPSTDPAGSGASASGGGAPTPSAPVNLNTANQAQLEALPGIGPSLAQAILAERDHEGGFHSVDDLRRVRGIGDVRFVQLKSLVSV
jgi:competence protein ComEA